MGEGIPKSQFRPKRFLRFAALGSILTLALAQLVRPTRNEGLAEGQESLVAHHNVPAAVKDILRRACYDCHSNHTVYPWYASVQPMGWWLNKHVIEGKAELNFSAFAGYRDEVAIRRLQSSADEVREHGMPLKSYVWIHRDARLTGAEVVLVAAWAEDLADEIAKK